MTVTEKKINLKAKEIIKYISETTKLGRPSDAEVEQIIEAVLWGVWNHQGYNGEEEDK